MVQSKRFFFFIFALSITTAALLFATDAVFNISKITQLVPALHERTGSSIENAGKVYGNNTPKPPLDRSQLKDPLPANIFVELAKTLNPTVVSITTEAKPQQQRGGNQADPFNRFLEEFFGGRGMPFPDMQPRPRRGLGSGFIIRKDGLIITNNHVIANADIIRVQLDQESTEFHEAEVIGRDARTDTALIKISVDRELPVARLGSSENLKAGEWVAAFGNPYGHTHTLTKGIISAIGRQIGELNRFPFIQTDASINPGNSGGPLVNMEGFVIGVNTAIDARAQGIGFAIPIDNIKQILPSLEREGRVLRGYIGVGIQDLSRDIAESLNLTKPEGVLVTQVEPDGPASKGGIEPSDVIIKFNNVSTPNSLALQNAVGDTPIGTRADVEIVRTQNQRRPKNLTLRVTVAEFPEDTTAPLPDPGRSESGALEAPYSLGFHVVDYSQRKAQRLGVQQGSPQGPIISEVDPGSPASRIGLRRGDIILDINQQPAKNAQSVVNKDAWRKGRNLIRVARGRTYFIAPILTE